MNQSNVEWSFHWLATISQATLQQEQCLHSPISICAHERESGRAGERQGWERGDQASPDGGGWCWAEETGRQASDSALFPEIGYIVLYILQHLSNSEEHTHKKTECDP